MADDKPAKKKYQLLADGMRLDGTEYVRGDTVELDPAHGDRLQTEFGSVGPVGGLEKQAKAKAQAEQLLADAAKPDPEQVSEQVRRPVGK